MPGSSQRRWPRGRRTAVLAAAATLAASVVAGSTAPSAGAGVLPVQRTSSGIDHKVAQAADDLAAANVAVTRAAASLSAARAAMPAAQAALQHADAVLATARAAAARAQAAERAAAQRAALARRRVDEARARIVATGRQIDALVRAVWIQGPYVELAAVLDSTTPGDLADRIAAVAAVSRAQSRALAQAQQAHADLALASAQALAAQQRATTASGAARSALADAAAAQAAAAAAQQRVAALTAQRSAALAVASRERARVKKQYLALRAEQRRLASIDRHGRGYGGRPSGSLIWPIPGAGISGGVGWRVHPVYGYKSCHTGVDIRGGFGTPIHAAADGVVSAVLSGGAYGLHTLINHGRGLSTMYAHQERVVVRPGQVVRQGQVIGYVGASGWVTGPHLHFEVHVNGVPYDPMGWFGGARVVVPCWAG